MALSQNKTILSGLDWTKAISQVEAMMTFIFLPNGRRVRRVRRANPQFLVGFFSERRDAQDEVRRISKLAHSKGQDCQINK